MKKRHLVIIATIILVAVALFLLLSKTQTRTTTIVKTAVKSSNTFIAGATNAAGASFGSQSQRPSRTAGEQAKAMATVIEKVEKALNTPITFYGRVVDESNQPIAGATIYFNAADKFDAPGSLYQKISDDNGFFTISGIHGADLSVGAAKEGYYSREQSKGDYNYGNGPHGKNQPPPTKENPAIFVLLKMGETEPLIHVERDVLIPKDGTPVEVDLATGRKVPAGSGNFRVQCWTHDEAKKPNQRLEYPWNCRVTAPGGGLQIRTDEFLFQAPEEGYVATDEMGMPQPGKRWNAHIRRGYFVMLANRQFARIQFEMVAAGEHFISIDAYINPTPGHRNLEFDPKKQIKTPR